jgi:hypothetical protein
LERTDQTENEKMVRKIIGELALFGLVAEIINPTCPVRRLAAERALFADPPSTEMKQLSDLLGKDVQVLNAEICQLLKESGFVKPNGAAH